VCYNVESQNLNKGDEQTIRINKFETIEILINIDIITLDN